MSYSLLLRDLAHPPTRQQLEEISTSVPGVARADCAGFLEHWLGIVVSNLELSDAQAFQLALRGAGYETDIVLDRDIPALHPDFRCQRMAFGENTIVMTDAMGRAYSKPQTELVFAAAGVIEKQKLVTQFRMETEFRASTHGRYSVQVEKSYKQELDKAFFRIDLFFSQEPYRISLEIDANSVMFYADRPMRLKNSLDLKILMTDLSILLPQDRMNSGLRERNLDLVYTSMNAYEEEIRWSFYRLGARG